MNIVITGLAWAGRDRLAEDLAARSGGRFIDGGALHPRANRVKLDNGEPLSPSDCAAWLDAIGLKVGLRGDGSIITCSVLRVDQRARIRDAARDDLTLVQLHGTAQTIAARMAAGGDWPPGTADLIAGQIRRLEPPTADEDVLTLDLSMPHDQMVAAILRAERDRAGRSDTLPGAGPHPRPQASPPV